jgi:hypothetical protein
MTENARTSPNAASVGSRGRPVGLAQFVDTQFIRKPEQIPMSISYILARHSYVSYHGGRCRVL